MVLKNAAGKIYEKFLKLSKQRTVQNMRIFLNKNLKFFNKNTLLFLKLKEFLNGLKQKQNTDDKN